MYSLFIESQKTYSSNNEMYISHNISLQKLNYFIGSNCCLSFLFKNPFFSSTICVSTTIFRTISLTNPLNVLKSHKKSIFQYLIIRSLNVSCVSFNLVYWLILFHSFKYFLQFSQYSFLLMLYFVFCFKPNIGNNRLYVLPRGISFK